MLMALKAATTRQVVSYSKCAINCHFYSTFTNMIVGLNFSKMSLSVYQLYKFYLLQH